jgi:hypothetical protein
VGTDRPAHNDRALAPSGGTVVLHSGDRDEFLRRVFDHPEVVEGAVWFTGPAVLDEVEAAVPCEQPQ